MQIQGVPMPVQMVLNALSRSDAALRVALPKMEMPEAPQQGQQAGPTLQAATTVHVLLAAATALETPKDKRRREARPAARGLEILDKLHAAQVKGMPDEAVLDALTQWAAVFEMPDDPDLADIARDIELRVRVELAKHDRTV
ncbi:MAG: hypothetical protein EOP58_08825 [Sphingomonadales bacterium]|nr:MAG: hypothetical protein EOP58_08825 [Sphingomonadales bacterium]